MQALRQSRLLGILSCVWLLGAWIIPLPLAVAAEPPPAPKPSQDFASLDPAREFIRNGDYDNAIGSLRTTLAAAQGQLPTLRETYLLLIKTYVFLGNHYKFEPQGREASNLNYQEARKLITECLGIRELRHALPEPATEFPEEMIGLFAEVRSEIFGSLRVVDLAPAGATVLLDADTLRALPGDSLVGEADIPVGSHRVVARARGYKDLVEEIVISSNSTLEQAYHLRRHRGPGWYGTIGTGAAGVAIGLIALIANTGKSSPASAEPLPTAPPPPAR